MILISIIYSATNYPERTQFIIAAGKDATKHYLITAESLLEFKDVEVVMANATISAVQFWKFAYQKVKEIIRSEKIDNKIIVHEYLSGVINFMLCFGNERNRAIRITSLYSVELHFFLHMGWYADKYSRKFFSLSQHLMWLRKSLPIMVMNFIAWTGSNVIVGNSSAVVDDFKMLFPNKQTKIINTSVNTSKFQPKNKDYTTSGTVKLLFFSRINPPKGLSLLLEALHQLRSEGVEFELDIIGGTWKFEQKWFFELIEHYQAHHHYRVLGKLPQDDLLPYLRYSDVLVFPSYYEGSPRALKEAMSAGLACLSSDLPGAKILDPDSESILFFKRGDLEDLKSKLRILNEMKISGELKDRSIKGREKAILFSKEFVVSKQIEMYRQLQIK